MNKEVFSDIMNALDQRRNLCFEYLGKIHTTEDLSNISIARAVKLKEFCTGEIELMTKICMVDLYHIIGMGNLSPNQMMQFTYSMQDYLSYRPRMKTISQGLDTINNLPELPITTKFRLLGLGDTSLTYGEGAVIDEAKVEDYSSSVLKAAKLFPLISEEAPFEINDRTILIDFRKIDFFAEIIKTLLNQPISVETLKKKIANQGEYLGIRWTGYFEEPNKLVATGTINALPIRSKLYDYLSCCSKNK